MTTGRITSIADHHPSVLKIAVSILLSAVSMSLLLVGSDELLAVLDPSYQPSSDVLIAVIIFVPAAFLLALILRQKKVATPTYFFLAASATFLPAVFIAAAASILLGRPIELLDAYNVEICGENPGPPYCGPAFAQYIFTRTLRAFPTILAVPYIYSFLTYDRRSPIVHIG